MPYPLSDTMLAGLECQLIAIHEGVDKFMTLHYQYSLLLLAAGRNQ